MAFHEGELDEEVVPIIIAFAASKNGDLRKNFGSQKHKNIVVTGLQARSIIAAERSKSGELPRAT